MVNIQYQDCAGNWITYMTVGNDDYLILNAMQQTQRFHNSRVRAVDMSGKLLDVF